MAHAEKFQYKIIIKLSAKMHILNTYGVYIEQ